MSSIIGFPNPVNEKAARTVAAGVAVLGALTLVTGWFWITAVLALGFIARALTGPRLSPLGQLATRVVAPRLGEPRLVPGPPKRFAQSIGAVVTTVAAVAALAFGWTTFATVLIALLVVLATLEAALGFCVGCQIFALLMKAGLIPEETCAACADISLRQPATP